MKSKSDLHGLINITQDVSNASQAKHHSRREVVRAGIKLAFVAPMISTFFAQDAMAYVQSCYPVGHACDGATLEPCCNGLTCTANVCT